jgi:hypothetical protein
MRTFLLVYDRDERRLRDLVPFDSRRAALAERVGREVIALEGGHDWEVVLLEATSVDVLKRTHPSYFRGVSELASEAQSELALA